MEMEMEMRAGMMITTTDANIRLSTDRSAVVDDRYHWISVDDHPPPVGPKLQLINRYNGVAVYGPWVPGGYFTHWCPIPTFAKDKK